MIHGILNQNTFHGFYFTLTGLPIGVLVRFFAENDPLSRFIHFKIMSPFALKLHQEKKACK
jgi:hypothetical protein